MAAAGRAGALAGLALGAGGGGAAMPELLLYASTTAWEMSEWAEGRVQRTFEDWLETSSNRV